VNKSEPFDWGDSLARGVLARETASYLRRRARQKVEDRLVTRSSDYRSWMMSKYDGDSGNSLYQLTTVLKVQSNYAPQVVVRPVMTHLLPPLQLPFVSFRSLTFTLSPLAFSSTLNMPKTSLSSSRQTSVGRTFLSPSHSSRYP
jgi:hypothetical protein